MKMEKQKPTANDNSKSELVSRQINCSAFFENVCQIYKVQLDRCDWLVIKWAFAWHPDSQAYVVTSCSFRLKLH